MECIKEGDSVEEAQKEGWISQWCQGTADICHKEDEENNDVGFVFSIGVCPEQGADQYHCGAGGPDPGGKKGSNQKENQVGGGFPHQVAPHQNAAGDGEKGP